MPDEAVVLSQDMFLLRKGAKQRLAQELVGRLYVARNPSLSRASSASNAWRRLVPAATALNIAPAC